MGKWLTHDRAKYHRHAFWPWAKNPRTCLICGHHQLSWRHFRKGVIPHGGHDSG